MLDCIDKNKCADWKRDSECAEHCANYAMDCFKKKPASHQTEQAEASNLERLVIYRCGWCGYPVDKDGELLLEIKDNDDANEYLKNNEAAETKNVNGVCCPNGNEECW
jgi:hypothetical protein